MTPISVKIRSGFVGEADKTPIYTGRNPYAPLSGPGLIRFARQPSAEEMRYVASVYTGPPCADYPQVVLVRAPLCQTGNDLSDRFPPLATVTGNPRVYLAFTLGSVTPWPGGLFTNTVRLLGD